MRPLLYTTLVLASALLAACHGTAGALSVTSLDQRTTFTPTFTTAAYIPIDPSTAEVFLSDIPASRLSDPNDSLLSPPASGSIVHIHVFLVPSAGHTPIDTTACNTTIRHLVLGGGDSKHPTIGLYGGGGFVLPSGDIGDSSISGAVDRASHRLIRATPAFADLLGPGQATGSFSVPRNETLARSIAAKLDAIVRTLPPAPAAPVTSAAAR